MRRITLVKKVLANGSPCPKCVDVDRRLAADGHLNAIDQTVIADERDPASEGMRLAAQLGVERAPFFVVENDRKTHVYTVYFRFVKDVLSNDADPAGSGDRDCPARAGVAAAEAADILAAHPELDNL